ncbi:hypothetical protein NX722_27625 [Endozoicomonas gorgoniicola]|uniref:Uncharacterized protein n=1 Tax=Endozoicomonas gorgoniicola TaxID=1234144 RepID=A0ABT3N3X6_9GAMM|nr:hypothetical protein [Endozoicomonas gorgoniicola]MCW7556335.1 hypothetical protein [Endozoicomonas gorgoniicola]
MAYPPDGSGRTGSPIGGSLEPEIPQPKEVGKHGSSSVTSAPVKRFIGSGKAHEESRPRGRNIRERTAEKYSDSFDPEGFEEPSEDEGLESGGLDELLDDQLRSKHPDNTSSAEPLGRLLQHDEDQPAPDQPPEETSPVSEESSAPEGRRNIQITSTEDANGDPGREGEQDIEAGLTNRLSFVDKIPYKKYLTGSVIGAVLIGVGMATFPAGALLYSVGAMMLSTSLAFMYSDDGSQAAPPPPSPDSGKKKKEENDSNKPDDTPEPSVPKNDFLAVENPDFQGAEGLTPEQEEAQRRMKELLNNRGRIDPEDITRLEAELMSGDSSEPLSSRMAKILAPVLREAGFDCSEEGWKAVSAVCNAAKRVITNPQMPEDELAGEMYGSTQRMLDHLPNLNKDMLMKYRSSAIALMQTPSLANRARVVFKAHIDAIDDRLNRLRTEEKRQPPPVARKPQQPQKKSKIAEIDRGENLGLGPNDHLNLENLTNRRHYFLLKAELINKISPDFSEQKANKILFAAYGVLSSPDGIPGALFIERLKQDPAVAAHQQIVDQIVSVQRRFKNQNI